MCTSDYRTVRRDGGYACIKTSISGFIICFDVGEPDRCQTVTIKQTLYPDLAAKFCGQSQWRIVILLGETVCGNGKFSLIEECKLKTVFCLRFRNLIGITCYSTAIGSAFNCLIQFPVGNRCASKRVMITDLQYSSVIISNLVTVHVDKVDRDICMFKAGVIEVENIFLSICSQHQRLFDCIREELNTIQFRMCSI